MKTEAEEDAILTKMLCEAFRPDDDDAPAPAVRDAFKPARKVKSRRSK